MGSNAVSKPVVVVVENPEEDPDVFVSGDVEVIDLTTYPLTHWGADEVCDYGEEYLAKIEEARGRFAPGTPGHQALSAMSAKFLSALTEAGYWNTPKEA